MKLERFPLYLFKDEVEPIHSIMVPKLAVFRKILLLLDGIYVFYTLPETILSEEHIEERFVIIKPGESEPQEGKFLDVVSVVFDSEDNQQGMIIFPIYKL